MLLNLLQYYFHFALWFFGHEACGIFLAPQPGIEPTPPALEGEALSSGPPGKSPSGHFKTLFLEHLLDSVIRVGDTMMNKTNKGLALIRDLCSGWGECKQKTQ